MKAFAKKGRSGNIQRKATRFLKHGYFLDVKVLEDCVRANVGDVTFEEAYKRTKRVLNISVSSTRKNETPRMLNYLTAPNVLIWSAACTSAAVIGLYETVDLLAKDSQGNIVHWSPSTIKWSDASTESENPEQRLSELFNVNHFIVSQANPYLAPFVSQNKGLFGKLMICAAEEVRHRFHLVSSSSDSMSKLILLAKRTWSSSTSCKEFGLGRSLQGQRNHLAAIVHGRLYHALLEPYVRIT